MSTNSKGNQASGNERSGVVENSKAPFGVSDCSRNGATSERRPRALCLSSSLGRVNGWLIKAAFAVLATSSFLLVQNCNLGPSSAGIQLPTAKHSHYARNAARSILEVFQVYTPVLVADSEGQLEISDGSRSNISIGPTKNNHPICQKLLVTYSFANSYNQPYVGEYEPPSCPFNRVTWNLTVSSAGKQFDRLAIVYLGDIEVFRTSTAEPTKDGVEWTYLKDMTSYLPLFKDHQKIIFDLGNLINNVYTAAYNVTLTASYFTANDSIFPADAIVPISKRDAGRNQSSVFMFPAEEASNNVTLQKNVKRAVVTIAATGQDKEEFWWSNVPQSKTHTFPHYGRLPGYSPFREIQLFIDGMLAGVAWPFPIIFTGGVVPGFWRPIVGIDVFDLKEYEVDITPWLPMLCNGEPHKFSIRVSGLADNGNGSAVLSETTDSYWWITGKIFLWFDGNNHTTSGSGPPQSLSATRFDVSSSIGKGANESNETLRYRVQARRSLKIYSTVDLSEGKILAAWSQDLSFSNTGWYRDAGFTQINNQETSGYDVSSNGYSNGYRYPLYAYSTETTLRDNITIVATINRGKDERIVGHPVFPNGLESFSNNNTIQRQSKEFEAVELSTNQSGTATYIGNTSSSASFSFGTLEQNFLFKGLEVDRAGPISGRESIDGTRELFKRFVRAVNNTLVEDLATLIGVPIERAA